MTAKVYWEERLASDFSLGGAGDRRLGRAYNWRLYLDAGRRLRQLIPGRRAVAGHEGAG